MHFQAAFLQLVVPGLHIGSQLPQADTGLTMSAGCGESTLPSDEQAAMMSCMH